jgi:hypothetical protein
LQPSVSTPSGSRRGKLVAAAVFDIPAAAVDLGASAELPIRSASMASPLYEALLKLDRGIAERWKARARDNPKHKLTPDDIDAICLPLAKGQTAIQERQAAALMELLGSAEFTPNALIELAVFVQIADEDLGLFRAGADPLVTADELKFVNDAFGMGVIGSINFKSPQTGLSYSPESYLAIQQLIAKSKIIVLQIRTKGLSAMMRNIGVYTSNSNWLYLYDSGSPGDQTMTIVHEATHAFQDWRNVKTIHKYSEADAYIAGAAADRATGTGAQSLKSPIYDVAYTTAKLVADRQAVPSNPAWITAYNNVVAAVDKSPTYAKVKNLPFVTTEKGEGSSESDQLDVILTAIEKRQKEALDFARWWGEAFKSTFGRLPGAIADVLP